jgi:hypothetical protein
MKIIAAILELSEIAKILDNLGLPTRTPPRSPAKGFEFIRTCLIPNRYLSFSAHFNFELMIFHGCYSPETPKCI